MLLGQSRVFYTMSKDGLLPKLFSDTHPKYKTPWKSNLLFALVVSLFAGFAPIALVGEMTSVGTLFAFVVVCAAVLILRYKEPNRERPFKTPLVPLIPILGILSCGALLVSLCLSDYLHFMRLVVWLAIGLVFYNFYGKKNSLVRKAQA
jgi:APA family basic amino acid/polyamine antiporter